MAEDRAVIRNLVERVNELSEIISPRSTTSVNAEVRSAFSSRTSFPNASSNIETLPVNSHFQEQPELCTSTSTTTSAGQTLRSQPSQQRRTTDAFGQLSEVQSSLRSENRLPMRRNIAFQTRRYFPAARPTTGSQNRRRGNRGRTQTTDNRPFLRDLILLSGPQDEVVPRQGSRLVLTENGHIISGARFTKDLSAAAVETRIIEAFDGKIPPDVDIEIMTSVHSSLTTPNLAPGQLLDGVMIHRIFRQKPLYIRPSQRLLDTGHEKQVVLRCF
jgi:hypothetical protein